MIKTKRDLSAKKGFVLPMAAWISIIISMLVMGALDYVNGKSQDMSLIRSQTASLPVFHSALVKLSLLLTLSHRKEGVAILDKSLSKELFKLDAERLSLDGTPFTITQDNRQIQVKIFDVSGLISLNALAPKHIEKFFLSQKVPAETSRRLADEIVDFRDPNDVRLLHGAESIEYLREGRRPPKNRMFNFAGELGRIPSYQILKEHAPIEILQRMSSGRSAYVNINSAIKEVLLDVFGFTKDSAQQFMQDRKTRGLWGEAELSRYTHTIDKNLKFSIKYAPSKRFRIELTDIKKNVALRQTIRLHTSLRTIKKTAKDGAKTSYKKILFETVDIN